MDINKIISKAVDQIEDKPAPEGFHVLLDSDELTDEIRDEIYIRFKNDIKAFIEAFTAKTGDPGRDKGMYKCSLETWQACASDIGRLYFRKNKYLYDTKKNARNGGKAYREELLCIALDVYADLCAEYRKQFFIFDCCMFMGLSLDTLYKLNSIHAEVLKKAHTRQESSMRTALASGRSNVTAMAILLNHDYDYTRTTQIIHTTDKIQTADALPTLKCNDISLKLPAGTDELM